MANPERQFIQKKSREHQHAIRPDGTERHIMSLAYQLRRATQYASGGAEPLLPPSREREEVLEQPETELKATYPKRYDIYNTAVARVAKREPASFEEQLETTHWLHIANSLDRYIQRHDAASAEDRTLYEPQIAAFRELQEFIEQGNMTGYFELPTGFGKTVLFSSILEALNTPPEYYVSKDMRSALRTRSLIVVPTLQLVK